MFTRTMLFRLTLIALMPTFTLASAHAQEAGHFHHLHMNVHDVEVTREFYTRIFGVAPIDYAGRMPALATERAFLFLDQVSGELVNHQRTGLTHGSWATTDGNHEYEWLLGQGVEFYEPVSELNPGTTYMYLYGPDREVIEMADFARHRRFNHIHLVSEGDAEPTARFLATVLAHPEAPRAAAYGSWNLGIDNVAVTVFPIGERFTPRENDGTLLPTDGSHLDHLAFSFRDLDAAYQRVQAAGIAIERPMATDPEYGIRHFFVRAPNKVLVELVEAKPWPYAAWE